MEKRGRLRRKTRLVVRFGAERPDKAGLVTNVSARGLYIATNAVLPPGSPLKLQVPVEGGEPLHLDGRVMRARRVPPAFVMTSSGGMGVRLVDAPDAWRTLQALPDEP